MENYMGENGLAAEEEYKWGHYTCGEYERTQSFPPHVPASHLMSSTPHPPFSMYPRSLRASPQLPATLRASTPMSTDRP